MNNRLTGVRKSEFNMNLRYFRTHWFFDDDVVIRNFRSVDGFEERPAHLVSL